MSCSSQSSHIFFIRKLILDGDLSIMWLRLAPGEWVVNISGYVANREVEGGDYLQCIFFFFFRKVGGREGRKKTAKARFSTVCYNIQTKTEAFVIIS